MKNIFTMLNLVKIKDQIKNVFTRFQISTIFIVIFSACLLSLLHGDFLNITEENIIRGALSSVIGFFFSLGAYLYIESEEQSKVKQYILQAGTVGYSLLYYLSFQNNFESLESIIFFMLSMAGIIGLLFFAPYIKNILQSNGKQCVYYTYFYNISVIILTSFILGGVLFSLGAIGITAVHELFDLNGYFQNDIYLDWAVISLAILTPLFTLSKIPTKKEFTNDTFNENVFFSFLVKYIAIPFIYVYFIILYAYSAKVLMNFNQWPKGEVSWMVIGFSIFGYLIYIFSYIFEEKNKYIKAFRKYFPYAVIPQVFMLFYAIYLRISQYDITINRYLIVIFGIWLLIISHYYIFSKKKYLGNIPVLLTLFTLIISIGPWSVYNLPESRQLKRLKDNLIEANILQGNNIIPLNGYYDIDQELSKNIYSGIDYVCEFNNCEKIKALFPEISKQILEEYNRSNINTNSQKEIIQPSKWHYVNEITEIIKVKSYFYNDNLHKRKSIGLYVKNYSLYPLNIMNGTTLYQVEDNTYGDNPGMIKANLNKNTNFLEFYQEKNKIFELDFNELSNNLYKIYQEKGSTELEKNDLIINDNTGKYTLFISSISIKNPNYTGEDNNFYFSLSGLLLDQ